jgi:hypothetical protein
VVNAVKIHGEDFIRELKQSLCLLHAAYNNRVLYDVLLFSTIRLRGAVVAEIQSIIEPAKLTIQYDEQTLQEQLAALTPVQQEHLLDRCNDATTITDLTW